MSMLPIILWDIYGVINKYISDGTLHLILKILLLIVITVPLLLALRSWIRSFITQKYAPHYGMLAGKLVLYSGFGLVVITILGMLGISLAPLLGAAGIMGVALGFASQTSVSNIISGLFLIAEQPFKVDDIITINNTTGAVLSIDILSVKLRTFDNRFVRIPNEMIIKTEVTNITRFPIRRFNGNVSVARKEDISRVREILLELAERNEYSLTNPNPLIIFDGFGKSSIDLLFLVWAPVSEYILLKNSIQEEIKQRFDEEGIEIPFPHVSLYAGSASKAMPVQLQDTDESNS